jgi:EmrB/QacA subfamily drug resistance transporter
MSSTSVSATKGEFPRFVAFIVFAAIFMAVVDGSVVNIALPTITNYYGVNVVLSQWVVSAYLVTMTSLLLIFGRLSEYVGRGRLFILGFFIFTLGSLACGLSPSLPLLIFFRVIQAIGGAMLFSISSAIIFQLYPQGEQGRAMGYVGATVAMGSIAGPVLGGFLVDTLGWEYIFLINVPIGTALLPFAIKYLPSSAVIRRPRRMDWIGPVLMVAFMVSLMFLLSAVAEDHAITPLVSIFAMLFLVSMMLFLFVERRVSEPLLDLSIFRTVGFSLPILATFFYFIAIFMVNIVGPFYLEGVIGLVPSQVGLVFLIMPLITIVGSPFAGWLYDRHYSRYYAMVGMAIAGLSMFILSFFALQRELWLIIAGFIPLTIGGALFQSPNNTEIMNALPMDQIGVASSISATVRNLGMALGVSFASILLVISSSTSGYTGPILAADPYILSVAASLVMAVSGLLCFLASGASYTRARVAVKTHDDS